MDTIKLYFPSVDKDNNPLDQNISNKLYKQIIKDISLLSGGCTITPCQGYYVNQLGQLINDDISLISTFTNELNKMTELIRNESILILKSLNQESVMIEINNKIEYIS